MSRNHWVSPLGASGACGECRSHECRAGVRLCLVLVVPLGLL